MIESVSAMEVHGNKDIVYDFEEALNLKPLMQRDSYSSHGGYRHFRSLSAYQNND
ncbi:hypothetical protein [Motilimonas sp. KMU-193]|uniref:hypothetical protein n=1 Tax=Motilimonas sp. KMU-193 TaxID=3388668 RepID=UPI00396AF4D7